MKKIILFLCVLLPIMSFSQNAQDIIDALKKDLQLNPDEKKKATIYSDLTWYYSNVSIDSALVYGNKAIIEATKLKDSTLIAQVYSDVGAVYFRKSDFASSRKNYLSAYAIRKKRNDKVGMAKVSINLASIYNKENKKELALKSYLEAVDYFEKINNQEVVSLTNANIAELFLDLKNYEKASKYINKAIEFQKINKQYNGLTSSYLTLGNIKLRSKDTINALKYYNKSIEMSKKTSNNITLVAALNNISKIKNDQNKNKEAEKIIQQTEKLLSKIKKTKDDTSYSFNKISSLLKSKKYNEAKTLLLQLKKDYTNDEVYKLELLQTYQYFVQTFGYLNQPDSVSYYSNASMKLQDKIIELTVGKQTNELESKYQTAKKEKALLEKDIALKNSRFFIFGALVLAVFMGVLGFLFLRQQKIKNKQQKQEFELKSALGKIESQNELQEQRLSISRDLHDNIGSQLTFIISSVENLKYGIGNTNPKAETKLSQISNFTKSTITELRDTIWAMNTNEIVFDDLRVRILNFLDNARIAQETIAFDFNIDEGLKEVKLTSLVWVNIYRTTQEAVNNAVKYSDATKISINVNEIGNQIQIQIKDNGKGFDLAQINRGNGLFNMEKRISDIGGDFSLQSVINQGTIILISIKK
ncbi:tetratricopeptide repeat-containing sensor histidine kinase [Flavobacterium amnicola]|uniref:histidine kinase n=1 Tax=Flavobacterium amnicola TaxID=2506422 RepID=A0A4Q1K5P3_9FLAO|nr:tetratricopeptide repeat-containing sensor histidine kinase [Flavobacterium amnicola]RXR20484.1 tetratricopeptide repeat-containing sensor histidine kinase [Flavobacterium amnicola]